jgi:hypothetical protein
VADTVGGRTAEKLIAKVQRGGCMHRLSRLRRTPRGTHL